ncbi:hypothetical protein KAR10_09445 [bacterium]|nr:hypothetical protein [bacterium]
MSKIKKFYQYKSSIITSLIIIGLVLAVIIRFGQLNEKTREGTTVGRLHELRQAILLYYQDHQGVFPRELNPNSPFGRYLEVIPEVEKLYPKSGYSSPAGNEITYGTGKPEGYGRGWYYNYESGRIFVNSIGRDSRGISYTTY